MSRILGRVLGDPAGPDLVRPRLPMLFEPGLGVAAGPDDIAAEAVHPGGSPSVPADGPQAPAGPAAGPPAVPGNLTGGWPLAAGTPLVVPSWPSFAESARAPGPAGPYPPEDAAPAHPGLPRQAHPGLPRQAHPVRPEPALPPAPSPAPPPATDPGPAAPGTNPVRPAPRPGLAPMAALPPMAAPAAVAHRAAESPAAGHLAAGEARGAPDAEPVVHISIGRVEIRADRAVPPPAERRASRPRPAAPDLSEYLKRRGRAR
jgi:hypothetical protein